MTKPAGVLREPFVKEWLRNNPPAIPLPLGMDLTAAHVGRTLLETGLAYRSCRISCNSGQGSGFLYGAGWVATNSHVLTSFDDVGSAKFEFTSADGQAVNIFHPHPRVAFRHRILPNGDPLRQTYPDLCFVKLGVQFEYGRQQDDRTQWEKDEEEQRQNIPTHTECEMGQEIQYGNYNDDQHRAFVVHFGRPHIDDVNTHKQFTLCSNSISSVFDLENAVIPVKVIKHTGHTAPGSSGSPVYNHEAAPIGISFAGNGTTSCAIAWSTLVAFSQKVLQLFPLAEAAKAYKDLGPYPQAEQKYFDILDNLVKRLEDDKIELIR